MAETEEVYVKPPYDLTDPVAENIEKNDFTKPFSWPPESEATAEKSAQLIAVYYNR